MPQTTSIANATSAAVGSVIGSIIIGGKRP